MTYDTKIAIEACCQATSGFGPSSCWIGRKSVRSKFNLLSVRSDSISKNVGPTHWTGPDRDRTEVVHPWNGPRPPLSKTFKSSSALRTFTAALLKDIPVLLPRL